MFGISLIEPTVYSVTPALATIERPGSTIILGTGEAVLLALFLDAVDDDLAVVLHGAGLVGQAVGDAEPAAGVEFAHRVAGLARWIWRMKSTATSIAAEKLCSAKICDPMCMCSPASSIPGSSSARLTALHRESLGQPEPELRVLLTGLDEVVRVGFDARRDADQNRLRDTALLGHCREALHLVEGVDDHATDAGVEALREFVVGLVVAVDLDALHRETRAHGVCELSARCAEQRAVFLGDDSRHLQREERLARVDDVDILPVVARPLHVLAKLVADVLLVHDVERRAGLARELDRVDATDQQVAVLDLAVTGKHGGKIRGRLLIRLRWRSRSSWVFLP